mgnify:CR=1 FL=1
MLPKLVITDIDGVWTDGGMYYTADGDVMKRFSVKDGWGVIFLRELGIPVAIMTGENTQIVQKRADKLKIKYCYLGVKDKVAQARELCRELGISLDEVAFIGDDFFGGINPLNGGQQKNSRRHRHHRKGKGLNLARPHRKQADHTGHKRQIAAHHHRAALVFDFHLGVTAKIQLQQHLPGNQHPQHQQHGINPFQADGAVFQQRREIVEEIGHVGARERSR